MIAQLSGGRFGHGIGITKRTHLGFSNFPEDSSALWKAFDMTEARTVGHMVLNWRRNSRIFSTGRFVRNVKDSPKNAAKSSKLEQFKI